MTTLPVLPVLYGFSITKKPVFQSIVQSFRSGREVTVAEQTQPLWEFELKYETLKDQTQNQDPYPQNLGFTAFETLSSIFVFCNGQYGRFLYEDLSDCSRSGQVIATGDGIINTFNLVSTITDVSSGNSFTQAIGRLNNSHPTTVYIDETPIAPSGNWAISDDGTQIIFVSAPSPGAVITMDFYYYYACRFISDEQDFEQFVMNWWTASIKFRSTTLAAVNVVPVTSGWGGAALSSNGTKIVMGASYSGPDSTAANGSIWISTDSGATFSKSLNAGTARWGRVAMSANGTYILALKNGTQIVLSQDGGASWSVIGPGVAHWGAFAVSDTGQRMVACSCEVPANFLPTKFWFSTDFGSTWSPGADVIGAYTPEWCALSSDGLLGWFAQNNFPATNKILHSTDGGINWAGVGAYPIGPSTFMNLVTGDGVKVTAVSNHNDDPSAGAFICTSTDSGATWTLGIDFTTPVPDAFSIASCAAEDGSVGYGLYFVVNGNPSAIYKTTDWWGSFGGTDIGPTRTTNYSWNIPTFQCSKDGQTIVVADAYSTAPRGQGAIWVSTDGGGTWAATIPTD